MKKILLIILISIFAFTFVNAQGDSLMLNKKGFPILPAKGDIAVGLSMSPITTYFGNFFHGNNTTGGLNATFRTDLFESNAVFLKYFIADDAAIRAIFEFTSSTITNSFYVRDDVAYINDPLSNAQVIDIQKNMYRNYVLGFGYEKRRGITRLQGLFGANILLSYNNEKTNYRYGNPMSAANPLPTTYNYGSNIYNGGRVLNTYDGEFLGLGANVFIGFEYFILPKISIGAELAYTGYLNQVKQSKFDYEYWNVDHLELVEATDPGDVGRAVGTLNPSANLFLMLHF